MYTKIGIPENNSLKSKIEELAKQKGLDLLARIPINPDIASAVDAGKIEEFDADFMAEALDKIVNYEEK